MFVWLLLIPFALILSMIIHYVIAARPFSKGRAFEIALSHLLFWFIGVMFLIRAYTMFFNPLADQMAAGLGWSPGNFFQQLDGIGQFSLGVLGITCTWIRGGFWVATVLFSLIRGVFIIASLAVNHVSTAQLANGILYDGVTIVILIVLLILYRVRVGYDRFWTVRTSK